MPSSRQTGYRYGLDPFSMPSGGGGGTSLIDILTGNTPRKLLGMRQEHDIKLQNLLLQHEKELEAYKNELTQNAKVQDEMRAEGYDPKKPGDQDAWFEKRKAGSIRAGTLKKASDEAKIAATGTDTFKQANAEALMREISGLSPEKAYSDVAPGTLRPMSPGVGGNILSNILSHNPMPSTFGLRMNAKTGAQEPYLSGIQAVPSSGSPSFSGPGFNTQRFSQPGSSPAFGGGIPINPQDIQGVSGGQKDFDPNVINYPQNNGSDPQRQFAPSTAREQNKNGEPKNTPTSSSTSSPIGQILNNILGGINTFGKKAGIGINDFLTDASGSRKNLIDKINELAAKGSDIPMNIFNSLGQGLNSLGQGLTTPNPSLMTRGIGNIPPNPLKTAGLDINDILAPMMPGFPPLNPGGYGGPKMFGGSSQPQQPQRIPTGSSPTTSGQPPDIQSLMQQMGLLPSQQMPTNQPDLNYPGQSNLPNDPMRLLSILLGGNMSGLGQ